MQTDLHGILRNAALAGDNLFNADHPLLMRHVHAAVVGSRSWDRVAKWYERVRDGIWYDPWRISFKAESLRASRTLEDQRGHCVAKSILFAAGCRAMGVPAVVGFARVRNHLATESLEKKLGTHVLQPHGYAAFWNGERWVKCTPVFNSELCVRLGVPTLEFSATQDTLFQAYDADGKSFMTYEEDFGLFSEVPLAQLRDWFTSAYPHIDPEVDLTPDS